MIAEEPILVILLKLIEQIPMILEPQKPSRGRRKTYPDQLIIKALVIMTVKRIYSAYGLLEFLEQETVLTRQLKQSLTLADGRFPSRRTWERRLAAVPETLPGLIGALGRHLVQLTQPWLQSGRAFAVDSTALRANGGVWHKKDREKGVVPHSSIDTQAHWSKSGYHGWWYGWKLHLACAVTHFWLPLAAELTVANTFDATVAPQLIRQLPAQVRFVLGDRHYDDKEGHVHTACRLSNRFLVTTKSGAYPHTDDGAQARRVFHQLRSLANEPFNGVFKRLFDFHGQVPVKGLIRVQVFVLGAVFVYQLLLLYQFKAGLPLGKGIKSLLLSA
ncbi:MAG: transposase [Chloroflexota bacterium]